MTQQTLSEMKILDLSWLIAGPFCTKLLADYGARVVKVERPERGDPARHIGPFLDDDPHPDKSILFSYLNLNKKGITLDLKSKAGREAVKDLASSADVLVESFSPGVMDRLGLGYEALSAINPKLIMAGISNFGQDGPYRDFKMSELVLSGIGADMYSNGLPGRYPLKLGGNCLQYQTGHMSAAAIMAAYWAQAKSGQGQYIDLSMQQIMATDTNYKSTNILAFAYSGMSMFTGTLGKKDPREFSPTIMPMGVFPCKDGHIRSAGAIHLWDRFIKIFPELGEQFDWPDDVLDLENKPLVDAVWYEWCLDHTKDEIMEICQNVKFFCMAINTPKDCLELDQLKERGYWVTVDHPVSGKQIYPGDPLHMEHSLWQINSPAPLLGQHNAEVLNDLPKRPAGVPISEVTKTKIAAKGPLDGIRVIDMGVIWAGPTTAWLMGALGAEVIHVDNPHHRDFGRGFTMWPTQVQLDNPAGPAPFPEGKIGRRPWNRNAFYNRAWWNRLSCCIDIKQEEGKEVFKKLIKSADIFVENNSATAMEHLGIDHKVLMEVNPRLICINMPAWGRSGPYKNYVGWGAMHQAIGGEEWIRGYPDDDHPYHNTFRFHMDSSTAPMAVIAAIMGLIHREKTGEGQWVDFAQMQAMLMHFSEIYMDAAWNKRDQRTMGNRDPHAVQGCYLCRGPEPCLDTYIYGGERWINITINNDKDWQALVRVMGNPDWAGDEKFTTQKSRLKNHDEIDRHIEAWTIYRDNYELFMVLQSRGIAAGPVSDYRDTHMDPQLVFRNFFETITGEDIGTYQYPGFPWNYTKTPLTVNHPPAMLGEDNDYVYRQVIGLSEDEISELEEKEVIGDLTYDWAGPIPDYLLD